MKTAHALIVSAAMFIAALVLMGLNYHPDTPTYAPGDTLPAIVGEAAPEQARQIRPDEGGAVVRQNPADPFIEAVYFGDVRLPGDMFEVHEGAAWLIGTDGQIDPDIDWSMGSTSAPDGIYMINDAGELVSLGQGNTK